MSTVVWVGNSQARAGQVTLTVTAVAVGGQLTATINGKAVVYTCVTGDTTSTAAAAWQALLADSSTAPPEFGEITWTVAGAVVTATASVPGVPFVGMTGGLTSAGAGGATVTQATVTASLSPSDVGLAANWLRGGVAGIPQNGDDVILADGTIPLLWNLAALAAVQFASFRRWQSFEGSAGLPEQNPLGYLEFRPTYFQFVGPPAGQLAATLGEGQVGGGPSRERYNVGAQRTNWNVLAAGSPADDFSVRLLGSNANNTLKLVNASVGVATSAAETAALASAEVDGGAALALGAGVSFSGTLKATSASLALSCAPAVLKLLAGCTAVVDAAALTFAAVTADEGTALAWPSNSTITALTLARGSRFDKSNDVQAMTITDSTIDGDCQIIDPNGTITFTNATTVNGQVTGGPFILTGPKTIKVS